MQTKVMFYVLPEVESTSKEPVHNDSNVDIESNSLIHQACLQAAYFYRQNQKVFIYTQDQAQAHSIDEMLWTFEPNSFVAHNLVGEGPRGGSPVEISWQNPTTRRPVLINLTTTVPNFTNNFSTIIDFVPTNELLKQQARDRYRTCKQWGFLVESQPAPAIT
ncbi:DNA polymerase III subunit chi [Colwellia sp. UCD-KL20]|uniref:DNA polymerase III subunit chi n=1 Tax=Colwellia sp. UCD-KL20 TaxID=1917165 RepID=UPI00097117AD|nr:DNA polymerase III subunit chi [Colwellia sp. UCD-KL20]